MTEQPDLEGVHVWTNGRPDPGFTPAPDDTRPLPPIPPPPTSRRRRSRTPLVVAALLAAGLLGAGSTAALDALTTHDQPVVGNNAPANGPGQGIGHGAPGNPANPQGPKLRIKGGDHAGAEDSGRGTDDDGQGND